MVPASSPRARIQATLAWVGSLLVGWRIDGKLGLLVAGVGTVLLLLAWLVPAAYAPVQRALDAITRAFLAGFTWAALAIVYCGVFAPLRFWRKMIRQDPLRIRKVAGATTYLESLPPTPPDHFRRQF